MKTILMHNGMHALVDDDDYDYLSKFHWTAHKRNGSSIWYAERSMRGKTIGMHRDVMKAKSDVIIDHKDRDGLNNQKANLREASKSQNNANRKAKTGKYSSSFLGVAFEKDRQKWTARIRKDSVGYRLGSFKTEIEAANAYNIGALKYHGEFANLNILP